MDNFNSSLYNSPVHKIAIIGAGKVGTTFAYALILNGLAGEIVLIDVDKERTEGEVMDLSHAVPLSSPVRIWNGEYADCAGANIIVITAGASQRPGETRLDLLKRNTAIFRQILPQVLEYNRSAILLIATNPVDVLSYAAWKFSGLPSQRVIGSGTILDTARFRYLLSQRFDVDPRSVHAFIIGEHGDSEVPVWSLANIAGMRLPVYCSSNGFQCGLDTLDEIFTQTRDAAYHIIERKGATYYAIATGLVRIVEAILRDQGSVLSVSSLQDDTYGVGDVYFSLPTVLDAAGVNHVIRLDLAEDEIAGLQRSARILRQTIESLKL